MGPPAPPPGPTSMGPPAPPPGPSSMGPSAPPPGSTSIGPPVPPKTSGATIQRGRNNGHVSEFITYIRSKI